MKTLTIVIISLVIGFSLGWALHQPPRVFDLQKALDSGGLELE